MAVKKPPRGTQFENKVRRSLRNIGFKDVNGGSQFIVGGFQVDAVGGWDDALLVIEATQTTRRNAQIRNRINEFKGESSSLRSGFKSLSSYSGYTRFVFAVVSDGYEFSQSDRKISEKPPPVKLIDYRVLEYYQKLAATIGKQPALFNFLGELEIEPRDRTVHRTPAFRVKLSSNDVGYLFFCEPQKLLEVAYVARRESGRETYYQRLLTRPRLKRIQGFINNGGIFPNNVILAFDNRPQFRPHHMPVEDNPAWLEWGVITFPKSYRAAWIIDGQHRLYAYGGTQAASSSHKLPVFAFEQLSISKQASFFIEINREQKPVSPDLIWDIESDLRPETLRGRIALTAKRLNQQGALKGRIYYPLSGEVPQKKIKISSICNDIQSFQLLEDKTPHMLQNQWNPLTRGVHLQTRVNRVSNGFNDFLSAILEEPEGEIYRDDVILRPGGITLILAVYEQVLIQFSSPPRRDELKDYAVAFATSLDQIVGGAAGARDFIKNRLTSYAQRREVIGQVIASMSAVLRGTNFGQGIEMESPLNDRLTDVERGLAKLLTDSLEITTLKHLRQRSPENVWREVQGQLRNHPTEPIHTFFSLGHIKQIMVRNDNKPIVVPHLTGGTNGFSTMAELEVALDGLIDLRNPVQHGRAIRNEQLGKAYLSAFERILA